MIPKLTWRGRLYRLVKATVSHETLRKINTYARDSGVEWWKRCAGEHLMLHLYKKSRSNPYYIGDARLGWGPSDNFGEWE